MKKQKEGSPLMQIVLSSLILTLVLSILTLFYGLVISETKLELLEGEVAEQNENLTILAEWLRGVNTNLVQVSSEAEDTSTIQSIRDDGRGDVFLQYLDEAQLTGLLASNEDMIRIYVPTNDAMEDYKELLDDFISSGNTRALSQILLNHIISTEGDTTNPEAGFLTASGNRIYVSGGSVTSDLEEATILEVEGEVVYIDAVLIPAI